MAEKVLVIEDAPLLQRQERDILEDEGYEVAIASTVADGLHLAEMAQPPFDLVISDNGLPDTSSGIQATAMGLTQRGLKAALLGYTGDVPTPTVADIYGQAGPDRPFSILGKGVGGLPTYLAAVSGLLNAGKP